MQLGVPSGMGFTYYPWGRWLLMLFQVILPVPVIIYMSPIKLYGATKIGRDRAKNIRCRTTTFIWHFWRTLCIIIVWVVGVVYCVEDRLLACTCVRMAECQRDFHVSGQWWSVVVVSAGWTPWEMEMGPAGDWTPARHVSTDFMVTSTAFT